MYKSDQLIKLEDFIYVHIQGLISDFGHTKVEKRCKIKAENPEDIDIKENLVEDLEHLNKISENEVMDFGNINMDSTTEWHCLHGN